MHFNAAKVSMMAVEILFKILSAHFVFRFCFCLNRCFSGLLSRRDPSSQEDSLNRQFFMRPTKRSNQDEILNRHILTQPTEKAENSIIEESDENILTCTNFYSNNLGDRSLQICYKNL